MAAIKLQSGDLIKCNKLLNRWNLPCCATVIEVNPNDTVKAEVWNIHGPGANQIISDIPISDVDVLESRFL